MPPRTVKLLLIGWVLLLVNSSYLAAYGDPSAVYIANLLLHMGLGLALAALGFLLLRTHWLKLSAGWKGMALLLASCAAFGVFLMIFGAARPHEWALRSHVLLGILGALCLTVLGARLRSTYPTPARALGLVFPLALLFPVAVHVFGRMNPPSTDYIINPPTAPESMEGEGAGPQSPFFPSSADTNVGGLIPATFFMTSAECARCHGDIYEQWNSSAHHFASFNNQWYRKSIEYMQDVIGTKPSKWCAGCHDHAVFFNGRFDRPISEQINTPEAQNGLGCTSCHSIVHVRSTMGQGDFVIEYPPLHDLATSGNRFLRWGHDFVTYADPEPHKRTFMKPFHRENTSEFCSSCHKVHLDVPVNHYRWFRGFNDYDNWQASGVSGQGARAFYYPAKPMGCADCHMPLVPGRDPAAKNGLIRSHRFPAANTALPFVNQDEAQLKAVTDFLKDGQISVDIFAVMPDAPARVKGIPSRTVEEQRLASTFGIGEESMNFGATQWFITEPAEVIGPLNRMVGPTVRRGDDLRVEVVVRTRKVGHFFPGGTVDAFDVWVELQAVDAHGRVIFWSGRVEDEGRGPVEKGAHFYRSLLVDEHGNPINKRNAWAAHSVAYVRLIPSGAADTVHYRFSIPPDCGDHITLRAKVNYRKFAWWNTQWAFAGVRDPEQGDYSVAPGHDDGRWVFTADTSKVSGKIKSIPNLPIVTMAEDAVTLQVAGQKTKLSRAKPVVEGRDRERWNDYGIGLLLQGDLKGAEAAFLRLTASDPAYVDAWVNIARARIQEGQTQAAAVVLRKALEIEPNLAKSHFFYALTLKAEGKYQEALDHLRTAAERYPRDRVVLNQIGRILFLQRRFDEAVDALKRVLAVDPEDLQAHYTLMLCHRGRGEADSAAHEEKLYRRFKADEASQAITGPYRQLHPEDNNERQSIHEHTSVPLNGGSRIGRPRYTAIMQRRSLMAGSE